jgi:hypothetical protein
MAFTGRDKRREKALVLVKALPHVGQKQGETVCCAGVTADGRWVRQFPIHFRRLQEKFGRWDWIEYHWIPPADDRRPESQRVQEESIEVVGSMPKDERSGFLSKLIQPSTAEAARLGRTLTLIRPKDVRFSWRKKTLNEIAAERAAYEGAANQGSFFDKELKSLNPCPYEFVYEYSTEDGAKHSSVCGDWETSATFFREEKKSDTNSALRRIELVFGQEYPRKGMVFAMGTHSLYPKTWLLVGVIRLDETPQSDLFSRSAPLKSS